MNRTVHLMELQKARVSLLLMDLRDAERAGDDERAEEVGRRLSQEAGKQSELLAAS